jgi:4-alpha-glucanotransferase
VVRLGPTFTPAVHRALVDLLSGSGSGLVLFLLQDILGTKERINTPSTVGAHNWTCRMPRRWTSLELTRACSS